MKPDEQEPSGGPTKREYPLTPAMLRELADVDVLPRLINPAELTESIRLNYPVELRKQGVRGVALVDVSVGDDGSVQQVSIATPPENVRSRLVLGGRVQDQTERSASSAHAAEFGTAAQSALQAARFSPAKRDGKDVPFTMRMTIAFNPD